MNNKSTKIINNRGIPGLGLPGTCGSILPLSSSPSFSLGRRKQYISLSPVGLTLPHHPILPHPTPQTPPDSPDPHPNWNRLSQAAPGHMMSVASSLLVPCQFLEGAASPR